MICRKLRTLLSWQAPVNAVAIVAVLAFAGASSTTARAAEVDEAAGFVHELGQQAIAVIAADQLSDAERSARLRQLFKSKFEVALIGRFVLGRYWGKATEGQREEYALLFEDFIVATYASRLARYTGESMTVEGARLDGENSAIVDSRLARSESEILTLRWHLQRDDAGWSVVDLVIEGISMAVTQRAEFASVIRGNGGGVEGLLSAMRQRTAGL